MIENQDIITEEIESAYVNIPDVSLPDPLESTRFGQDIMREIQELQVGYGSKVMRVDQSGLWLGGETFATATFSVDMDGNVIAESYATAASGERIVIGTGDTNQIKFYDDNDLYGILEVHNISGSGYITLGVVAGDTIEAGMRIDVDVGASGFNSVEIVSNGGGFFTNGNASSGFNDIIGKTTTGGDKFFGIHTVATVDYLMTDLLPVGDPAVAGALYQDGFGVVMVSL